MRGLFALVEVSGPGAAILRSYRLALSVGLRVGRPLDNDDVVAVGVSQHEHQWGAGRFHRLGIEVDASECFESRVLATHIRRLDADPSCRRADRSSAG